MDILIEKIILNENGMLCVKPQSHSFNMIYRSSTGIHWNNEKKCLYHNMSQEWDTLKWFKQMILAVKSEYGVVLKINQNTIYENINEDLKAAIENEKI